MARNPDHIEDEIEVTRARIESRLDALSSQFTPSNIVERALGTTDLGSQDSLEVIAQRARQSPISTALIGAGLVGLFLAGRRETEPVAVRREVVRPADSSMGSADPAQRVSSHIDRLSDAAKTGADDVRRTAASTVDGVKSSAKAARDTVSGAVDSVAGAVESMSESVGHAAESALGAARAAPVRARAQGEMMIDWVKENPLPAGLMALAAGAAVSSLLATRRAGEVPADRYKASRELHEDARREEELRAMRRADAEHLARNAPEPAPATAKPPKSSAKKRPRKATAGKTSKPAATKASRTTTGNPAPRIVRDTAVLGDKPTDTNDK